MSNTDIKVSNIKSSLKSFYNVFKPIIGKRIYLLVLLSLLSTALESFGISILIPFLNKIITSGSLTILFDGKLNFLNNYFKIISEFNLNTILVILFLAFLLRAFFLIVANSYRIHLKFYLQEKIKKKLIKNFFNQKIDDEFIESSGYYNNLISDQSQQLVKGFDGFLKIIMFFFTALIYLSLSFLISFKLTFLTIFLGFIIILLFKKFNNIISSYSKNFANQSIKLSSLINQSIQSSVYLLFTNQKKKINKISFQAISKISIISRNIGILNTTTSHLLEPLVLIALLASLMIGIYILNIETGILFLSLIFVYRGLTNLTGIQLKIQGFLSSIGSVYKIEEELNKISENQINNNTKKKIEFNDQIEFDQISFAYGNSFIFERVTLKIKKNELVCFIGKSGEGKSTLAKLISLLVNPKEGNIKIDKNIINSEFNSDKWRSSIGYLSQNFYIYNDTLLNNITLKLDNSDISKIDLENVNRILKDLDLFDLVNKMPNKHNQLLNEMGSNLSNGQKQRIVIARELYRDIDILILDEPTSALDKINRDNLIKLLKKIKKNLTIIIMTHDLELLTIADKSYEIKNKKIEHIKNKTRVL